MNNRLRLHLPEVDCETDCVGHDGRAAWRPLALERQQGFLTDGRREFKGNHRRARL
jgi:hypothetical protein